MPHFVPVPTASERWQEGVIAAAPDGVLLVDADGVIVEVNAAAERIFRLGRDQTIGRSVQALVPERFRASHAEQMAEFLALGLTGRDMAQREPIPALRANGEEFLAEIALVPVEVDGARAVACIVRDVSERVRLEAEVRAAERLESVRVLSGGVAHDFNNMLSVILGNAEFAAGEVEAGSPAALALEDIRGAARRAAELAQQMMRFAGLAKLALEPLDLAEVAREMLQLLRGSLGPGIAVVAELGPARVAEADRVGMRQVVMNLVMNAAEAMPGGGRLTVRTGIEEVAARDLERWQRRGCGGCRRAVPGTFAFVAVEDTGTGMDRDTMGRIFEPYFSTKFAGRGLGLAGVLGVVEAHRGIIRVESEAGRGSRFRVLVPVGGAAAVGASARMF